LGATLEIWKKKPWNFSWLFKSLGEGGTGVGFGPVLSGYLSCGYK